MARYAIGDIQGCYEELRALLDLIQFNPNFDKVYLVGDLVNRGPQSLEVLRYVKKMYPAIEIVLGNHDLHLLACWAGVSKVRNLDTLDLVLNAADVDELMNWLRQQPLLLELSDCIITHAGVNPNVCFDVLRELAKLCSGKLAGGDFRKWLELMYGNAPAVWGRHLTEEESFRFGVNSLTRMRMINSEALDLKFKGEVENAPQYLMPWFSFDLKTEKCVVFGHWSALGLIANKNLISLDTGCVWGGQLTAISLDNGFLYQVPAFSIAQAMID